jgi:hypothetical protein
VSVLRDYAFSANFHVNLKCNLSYILLFIELSLKNAFELNIFSTCLFIFKKKIIFLYDFFKLFYSQISNLIWDFTLLPSKVLPVQCQSFLHNKETLLKNQ